MAAGVDIAALTAALKRLSKEDLVLNNVKKCVEFVSVTCMSQGILEKSKSDVSTFNFKWHFFCDKRKRLANPWITKKCVTDLDYTIKLPKDTISELSSELVSTEKPSM